jgi:hypothetical protein
VGAGDADGGRPPQSVATDRSTGDARGPGAESGVGPGVEPGVEPCVEPGVEEAPVG